MRLIRFLHLSSRLTRYGNVPSTRDPGLPFLTLVPMMLPTSLFSSASSIELPSSGPMKVQRMKVYGHRGASHCAPENTLSSIRESFRTHADGVEFDLQMTSDGVIVLLHDETMERTTTPWSEALTSHPHLGVLSREDYESLRTTPVNELTFDQIRHLDIGSWKDACWAGETLCTFREALDVIMAIPGKGCFPEIKGGDLAIVSMLQRIVMETGVTPAQATFIGFDEATMLKAKALMPTFKSLHIAECKTVESALALVHSTAKTGKLDGIDFQADASIVTPEVCMTAHAAGLQVAVWVTSQLPFCDTMASWQKLRDNGIDIFTSDLPPEIIDWNHYPGRCTDDEPHLTPLRHTFEVEENLSRSNLATEY